MIDTINNPYHKGIYVANTEEAADDDVVAAPKGGHVGNGIN